MKLMKEKETMTEYEIIVPEIVMTQPGNAEPVFSTPFAS